MHTEDGPDDFVGVGEHTLKREAERLASLSSVLQAAQNGKVSLPIPCATTTAHAFFRLPASPSALLGLGTSPDTTGSFRWHPSCAGSRASFHGVLLHKVQLVQSCHQFTRDTRAVASEVKHRRQCDREWLRHKQKACHYEFLPGRCCLSGQERC